MIDDDDGDNDDRGAKGTTVNQFSRGYYSLGPATSPGGSRIFVYKMSYNYIFYHYGYTYDKDYSPSRASNWSKYYVRLTRAGILFLNTVIIYFETDNCTMIVFVFGP
jgi:hypothetical protein